MESTNKKVGKQRKKPADSNLIDIKNSEEKEKVKVNWPRITLLGFITSILFVIADIIIVVIIIEGIGFDPILAQDIMQYVIFGEVGFLILIGACVGNFGQSIALTNLRARLFKSAPMSRESFREATFNAFTYFIAGTLLLVYFMILVQVLILIERFT